MINAIDSTLRHIRDMIPEDILKLAFADPQLPIDTVIKDKVIYNTAIPDCNLSGGKVIDIMLEPGWVRTTTGTNAWSVYEIPENAREGRNIIEVHGVSLKGTRLGGGADDTMLAGASLSPSSSSFACVGSSLRYAANNMLESKSPTGDGYPIAEISDNLVILHPPPQRYVPWWLACRIGYDDEMTNLNSAALLRFTDVCVIATKRFCYNTLIFKLRKGQYEFGRELEEIRETIMEWKSLDVEYREACELFAGATMQDIRRFERFISAVI